ncbi:MAG: 16S rRNA (cytosine(967)-C(5))-methyltransferase RsmB [Caldicoprobacterales bacterium]|jgi:16S rRNA (cytosine967-C5)-methyltransferase|nr:16S rRNA (cytosine(967)-C(5))-methyltransferase RsmB [Clostridiales bacterium]
MDKVRKTALIILKQVNEDRKYANISLKENLDKFRFQERDASFITQLVYGTLENQAFIDNVLRRYAKMKGVNPWVENILRLGCYQILYLDRVPDSAACNESVKLCTGFGFNALKGFVNGVLRNISRNKEELKASKQSPVDTGSLSSLFGIPLWLVELWVEEYGIQSVRDIVKSTMDTNFTTIRVNGVKMTRDELVDALEQQGIDSTKSPYFDNALRVNGIGNIQLNPLYKKGMFTVQGESSILVCKILAPKPGERILDACSAPGGKAIYIAELMNMSGKVYAHDIHDHRVELINKNVERMGMKNIETRVQDATIFNPKMEDSMDRVLIDAPCSGWGVLHKKPDIRLRIEKKSMESLYRLQWDILDNCRRYVKPGGILVYSTCTINPWENHKVIEKFIRKYPEFVMEDLSRELPQNLRDALMGEGMIQLFPGRHGVDGFFIAKMRRTVL